MSAGALAPGPASPAIGLPFPDLHVGDWQPPQVIAGDLQALAAAVGRAGTVTLSLGPRLTSGGWREAGIELVKSLGAGEVKMGPVGHLAGLLREGSSLPVHRIEPDRPRYDAHALALEPSAVQSRAASGTVLAVDEAALDLADWGALPTIRQGTCMPAMQRLASGQELSLAMLAPFLDHADETLWQVYRSLVADELPGLRKRLKAYAEPRDRSAFRDPDAFEQHQCGHAYWQYLQTLEGCDQSRARCPGAPRVYLVGGAQIGMREPSVYLPEGCAERLGHDYLGEIRELGFSTVSLAGEHFDRQWGELAARLGAVAEVHAALEDACAPRRRRFAASDLEELHGRLGRIGDLLSAAPQPSTQAYWLVDETLLQVPGVGPVRQLSHFDPGHASVYNQVIAQARGLREFALGQPLCQAPSGGRPLAVMMVDVAAAAVTHFGYFYEEELICGDLPVAQAPSENL
ncbi:MAG: hypothetical protein ACPG4T_05530 [Nannocystaceae bacterium]